MLAPTPLMDCHVGFVTSDGSIAHRGCFPYLALLNITFSNHCFTFLREGERERVYVCVCVCYFACVSTVYISLHPLLSLAIGTVCWSPKGKQLAVGLQSGGILQLSPSKVLYWLLRVCVSTWCTSVHGAMIHYSLCAHTLYSCLVILTL